MTYVQSKKEAKHKIKVESKHIDSNFTNVTPTGMSWSEHLYQHQFIRLVVLLCHTNYILWCLDTIN